MIRGRSPGFEDALRGGRSVSGAALAAGPLAARADAAEIARDLTPREVAELEGAELALFLTQGRGLKAPELGPLVRHRGGTVARLEGLPGGDVGVLLTFLPVQTAALFLPSLFLGSELPFWIGLCSTALIGATAPLLLLGGLPWLRRRRMRTAATWSGEGDPPAGVIRVAGTVQPVGDPFVVPGHPEPVVYVRRRFPWREDVRGVAFRVQTAAGPSVLVEPASVRLLDPTRRVPNMPFDVLGALGAPTRGLGVREFRQSTLAPGDRIELVGTLQKRVAPTGAAAPGRGVPMQTVMTPAWKGGVWIRRIA